MLLGFCTAPREMSRLVMHWSKCPNKVSMNPRSATLIAISWEGVLEPDCGAQVLYFHSNDLQMVKEHRIWKVSYTLFRCVNNNVPVSDESPGHSKWYTARQLSVTQINRKIDAITCPVHSFRRMIFWKLSPHDRRAIVQFHVDLGPGHRLPRTQSFHYCCACTHQHRSQARAAPCLKLVQSQYSSGNLVLLGVMG